MITLARSGNGSHLVNARAGGLYQWKLKMIAQFARATIMASRKERPNLGRDPWTARITIAVKIGNKTGSRISTL